MPGRCRHPNIHKHFHNLHRHHREFHNYYKYLKFLRPLVLLFNIFILYLLFRWTGIKAVVIFVAFIICVKEIVQVLFLWRLEKRIFKPIDMLKNGVEEIAKGNYNVHVETDVENEITVLIEAFNEMAQELQESERLKSEYEENRKALIANISHDLKTPITSIQGYIEALREGIFSSPEKARKYLEIIYQDTTYMNRLIDDLFLFSKLDMAKLDFRFEATNVSAFMRDLMGEFKFELEEKGVDFYYIDKLEQDAIVYIDGKRVYQAIRNIIGNAVRYGPEDNLRIDVALFRENDSVHIEIKDNGPGIPADKLPYIFERFFRIDSERTKNLMSTGLGLAIARELIEAHEGGISVCSSEGAGSCFVIALPVLEGGKA